MGESYLVRWKLFGKSRSKKEEKSKEMETTAQENKEVLPPEPEKIDETSEETEELPVTDYRETLYSNGDDPKKSTTPPKTDKKPWKQKSWESPYTIEKNVDDFGKKKIKNAEKTSNSRDLDKKVDRLLSKKKQ